MPLPIHVDERHGWDYTKDEFVDVEEQDVVLEHCLLAISKWEAKHKKPFFVEHHSYQEWVDYIQCMALDTDKPFAHSLPSSKVREITEYIQNSQTATWFSDKENAAKKGEQLTSELLYYYMAQVPLPFDICERWHLSRLLTILRIAAIKSQPDKKMSHSQIAAQNRALNAARHAKLSKGKIK